MKCNQSRQLEGIVARKYECNACGFAQITIEVVVEEGDAGHMERIGVARAVQRGRAVGVHGVVERLGLDALVALSDRQVVAELASRMGVRI